jgi:hypothetical protein
MLVRAHWLLEEGRYRSAAEIAEAENIARSYITRLPKLTLLAPDIQDAILEGRPPKGMQLEELTGLMIAAWSACKIPSVQTCAIVSRTGWCMHSASRHNRPRSNRTSLARLLTCKIGRGRGQLMPAIASR